MQSNTLPNLTAEAMYSGPHPEKGLNLSGCNSHVLMPRRRLQPRSSMNNMQAGWEIRKKRPRPGVSTTVARGGSGISLGWEVSPFLALSVCQTSLLRFGPSPEWRTEREVVTRRMLLCCPPPGSSPGPVSILPWSLTYLTHLPWPPNCGSYSLVIGAKQPSCV